MNEFLSSLLIAVITATVPVLAAHGIKLITQAAERAAADTDDIKKKGYIKEIADAITDAVAATSQTFVDALKRAGNFTQEKWVEAADKALTACLASISPAAKAFIDSTYGDAEAYLKSKIEAEVRKQKNEAPATLALPLLESTTDTQAVAVTTAAAAAAATAATIAQTTVQPPPAAQTTPEQTE